MRLKLTTHYSRSSTSPNLQVPSPRRVAEQWIRALNLNCIFHQNLFFLPSFPVSVILFLKWNVPLLLHVDGLVVIFGGQKRRCSSLPSRMTRSSINNSTVSFQEITNLYDSVSRTTSWQILGTLVMCGWEGDEDVGH